jgi:hypothetical protein
MLAENSNRYRPERDLVDNLTGQVVPDPSNNQTASDPYVDVGPRVCRLRATQGVDTLTGSAGVDRNTSVPFGAVCSSELTVDRVGFQD